MGQRPLALWEHLSFEARERLLGYNHALDNSAIELKRKGLTFDEALNKDSAQPMVQVLVSEVPGIVCFVLEQALPIILDELRLYLSFDALPTELTKLILETTFGPTATTSPGQSEILALVQRFGEQLLLGESSITTASQDA